MPLYTICGSGKIASNFRWGFPKFKGTMVGITIKRTIVFWGILGSPYFGKLHETTTWSGLLAEVLRKTHRVTLLLCSRSPLHESLGDTKVVRLGLEWNGFTMVTLGLNWSYIEIMENKMETAI